MIRIAICDDEQETLHDLGDTVTHYGEQKNLDLSIDQFIRAKDLADKISHNSHYEIYILDMLMPHLNGIDIGQLIRRQDAHAVIIYLTSSMDFAYQAFGVFAQRYLLKPLKETELFEALEFAAKHALQMQQSLYIKTAQGIQQIFYQEIEYVENAARALHVFATDGKEITSRLLRKSFENDMDGLLKSPDFVQTHKSFIVNLGQVRLYGPGQLTMRSGAKIPVSKSRQTGVKRAYLSYISESY